MSWFLQYVFFSFLSIPKWSDEAGKYAQSEQRGFMLQVENKTRQEAKVQEWEGNSVNVIPWFAALGACGQSYTARKKCKQMKTLSDVAKLTFWETRKN